MATATVASSTNTNIEKIGSIKVLSSTSPTANEKCGLIFGGYATAPTAATEEWTGPYSTLNYKTLTTS